VFSKHIEVRLQEATFQWGQHHRGQAKQRTVCDWQKDHQQQQSTFGRGNQCLAPCTILGSVGQAYLQRQIGKGGPHHSTYLKGWERRHVAGR
jgi:hypothetical protein